MEFLRGFTNLTNWLANVIMPTLAGLFFVVAALRYSRSTPFQNSLYAGFAALMVSVHPRLVWMLVVAMIARAGDHCILVESSSSSATTWSRVAGVSLPSACTALMSLPVGSC